MPVAETHCTKLRVLTTFFKFLGTEILTNFYHLLNGFRIKMGAEYAPFLTYSSVVVLHQFFSYL